MSIAKRIQFADSFLMFEDAKNVIKTTDVGDKFRQVRKLTKLEVCFIKFPTLFSHRFFLQKFVLPSNLTMLQSTLSN